MSFFDKAQQIQEITAELEQLKLKLSEQEKELLKKQKLYDKLNSGLEDYTAQIDLKRGILAREIDEMSNSLKQLKYELKQQKKIRESNEKEEKKRKSLYQKEISELEDIISNRKSELSEIQKEIKNNQDKLDTILLEMKKLEKKKGELIEENTKLTEYIDDQKRFIKNLNIREQIISQREERLNKIKLCQDSK